jgi:hypothetical protein
MRGRGGTEDREIGAGFLETLVGVRENAIGAEAEVARGLAHALRLLIANADDLGVLALRGVPEQVAHVKMIEVDPDDFAAAHGEESWLSRRSA